MILKLIKMLFHCVLWFLLLLAVIFGLPRLITEVSALGKIKTVDTTQGARVAIVFGAGLQRDGKPSPVLQARVSTAVNLYQEGKVEKLLMSGDNRFIDYNEPGAMRAFAMEQGVPQEDIVLDFAGRRTYDTCYRAFHIFGVKNAVLVTQRYHLPRALLTCNAIGIDASGVVADFQYYRKSARAVWYARELPATLVALVDVWVRHPLPVMGEAEPIFSEE
jgi:SanA protein